MSAGMLSSAVSIAALSLAVNMKYLTLSQVTNIYTRNIKEFIYGWGGIKETEARPCLRDQARTCEISDTYIHRKFKE
jgi:hypothetical protein